MDSQDLTNDSVLDDQEQAVEKSLRPQFFRQYIGQERIKYELQVYIKAAQKREEALDHVLLYGPPGLGKTTLALVIANELGVNLRSTTGPSIEKAGDLVAILSELQAGDVLFIDEIHRLPKNIEEILYSAMEDFFIDIVVGQGAQAHAIHYPLPPFTLIGATTQAGQLSAPLRERFGIVEHLIYYDEADLTQIILRSADVLQVEIEPEAAHALARRSRGTPRVANRLLKRVRDFAQVADQDRIQAALVQKTLDQLQVDSAGLNSGDRKLLQMMIDLYQGGPLGLKTMAVNIGEEQETVEAVYEPYLLQQGFLKRTVRGRMVTNKAYQHLGLTPPQKEETK
ncbi:Holliday junction branch migration DNA helicase RuvB [Lactobacillus sp. DCY120]|uniref:Holliday junction branch migration complex subunit RuvB n=1 Tax=Bombilactobacillus apium TaxID=2675299 RepID=A0A850RCU0_9LACO|nr:Holliday junction branch migration DNA helicase RuvB [Bombilactobacillus apium]NVY97106.1 Holliday junction branch migration DNA helicase RuvB [Bombilactobacillus apium]